MPIQRNKDGKHYDTLTAAVADFICPVKLCSDACPLHELVPLSNGIITRKCHPDYVSLHPAEVLRRIGCSSIDDEQQTKPTTDTETTYIAVLRAGAVRDTQYCTVQLDQADPLNDDHWANYDTAEIYLGQFTGPDPRKRAANFAQTHPDNIRLIPVQSKQK